MKYTTILLAFFLSCGAVTLYSQQPQQQNPDLNKQVSVTRDYEPTMTQAPKINFKPEPEEAIEIETEINYSVLSSPLRRAFGVRALSPYYSLLQERKKEHPGYLTLGAGFPFHTQAGLYYGSARREKAVYGIYGNHEGLFAKLKNDQGDKIRADRTFNDIGLFGQFRFNERLTVRAAAEYDYRNVTRYGYYFHGDPRPAAFDTTRNGLSQHFDIFKAQVSGGTPFTDLSFLNARVGVDVAAIKDRFGYSENSGIAQLKLGKNVAGDHAALLLTGEFAWASRNDLFSSRANDRILSVEPIFRYLSGGLTFEAGARFSYDLENDKSRLYPVAKLQVAFAGGRFTPYIAAGGSYEMNSYLSLVNENPYLHQGVTAPPTSRRNYTAGFRGSIASSLSYHVFGRIEHTDNSLYFTNLFDGSTACSNTFGIVADNTKTTSFGVELLSDASRKLNLYTKILYSNDDPDHLSYAYGRPDWDILFRAGYRINDRWSVSGNARYLGRRYFYEQLPFPDDAAIIRRPPAIDIGMGIDYIVHDRLAVWLKLENLANDKLYRFNRYPELGTHITAGAKISF